MSRGIGDYTGEVATSLEDFADLLGTVELKSIGFHWNAETLKNGLVGIFGDEELARMINRRAMFQGENRRNELVAAAKVHLENLKRCPKLLNHKNT